MRLGYDVLPMINGRECRESKRPNRRASVASEFAFVMHRIRHSRDNEKSTNDFGVIIRPVELSDEFTDRDYCNELIHFIPLCGEVILSRNCAFFLVEEIAQLYAGILKS